MPRQRSPERDRARGLWQESGGQRQLKDIAAELDVGETLIRKWKSQDNWDAKVTLPKKTVKSNVTKETKKKMVKSALSNEDLTDMEKLFCLEYMQCFNAKLAAIRAGYSNTEHVKKYAYTLMQKPKIQEEIKRLKQIRAEAVFAGPDDIVDRMMRIAFADITDVVEFGRTSVPVMTMYGPLKKKDEISGETVEVMKDINDVRFKDFSVVDGGIIESVKMGRDGASVKLADSQKALEWLANYFGMNHMDKHKIDYDRKRLALEERRVKVDEDKLHGMSKDVDEIKDNLNSLLDILNNPVPDRSISDE